MAAQFRIHSHLNIKCEKAVQSKTGTVKQVHTWSTNAAGGRCYRRIQMHSAARHACSQLALLWTYMLNSMHSSVSAWFRIKYIHSSGFPSTDMNAYLRGGAFFRHVTIGKLRRTPPKKHSSGSVSPCTSGCSMRRDSLSHKSQWGYQTVTPCHGTTLSFEDSEIGKTFEYIWNIVESVSFLNLLQFPKVWGRQWSYPHHHRKCCIGRVMFCLHLVQARESAHYNDSVFPLTAVESVLKQW